MFFHDDSAALELREGPETLPLADRRSGQMRRIGLKCMTNNDKARVAADRHEVSLTDSKRTASHTGGVFRSPPSQAETLARPLLKFRHGCRRFAIPRLVVLAHRAAPRRAYGEGGRATPFSSSSDVVGIAPCSEALLTTSSQTLVAQSTHDRPCNVHARVFHRAGIAAAGHPAVADPSGDARAPLSRLRRRFPGLLPGARRCG